MDKRKLPQILLIAAATLLSIGAVLQFIRGDYLSGGLILLGALLAVAFLMYVRKAPTP